MAARTGFEWRPIGDRRATFIHKVRGGNPIQRFYSPRRRVVISHGRSCNVHYWSNLNIKDSLARLRRNQDPANGVTWEVSGTLAFGVLRNDVAQTFTRWPGSERRRGQR